MTRAQPEPTSLSARARQLLAGGPMAAVPLMQAVCRLDRLSKDAAERMSVVLLGHREEFVQLDDDCWALLEAGQVVRRAAGTPVALGTTAPAPVADTGQLAAQPVVPLAQPVGRQASAGLLDELPFAVVDVETTGSRGGSQDRITEIAIVPVCGGVVGEPWQQLVHPGRSIPAFITGLTGISNAMVAAAPGFAEVSDEVAARLDGQLFVAHNVAFDWGFVDHELARAQRTRLSGARLCTVRLSRKLLPQLPRRSLDRVAAYFGVSIAGRHRAGGDALATAHVLVHLIELLQAQDIHTWDQLQRYLGRSTRRGRRPSSLPTHTQEDSSA